MAATNEAMLRLVPCLIYSKAACPPGEASEEEPYCPPEVVCALEDRAEGLPLGSETVAVDMCFGPLRLLALDLGEMGCYRSDPGSFGGLLRVLLDDSAG